MGGGEGREGRGRGGGGEGEEKAARGKGEGWDSTPRHVLLVLLFLLLDRVLPEVQEYNRQNPREEPLVDPSSDVIEVTLLLSTWYRLFGRCDPPKDEDDLKELQELGDWYPKFSKCT